MLSKSIVVLAVLAAAGVSFGEVIAYESFENHTLGEQIYQFPIVLVYPTGPVEIPAHGLTPDIGTAWNPAYVQPGPVSPLVGNVSYAGNKGFTAFRPVNGGGSSGGGMYYSLGSGKAIDTSKQYVLEAMTMIPDDGTVNGFALIVSAGPSATMLTSINTDSAGMSGPVDNHVRVLTNNVWETLTFVPDNDTWYKVEFVIDLAAAVGGEIRGTFGVYMTNTATSVKTTLIENASFYAGGGLLDADALAYGWELTPGPVSPGTGTVTGDITTYFDELKIIEIP